MKINALDHINIITADIAGTVTFYTQLFGLEARNAPARFTPQQAQWLYDEAGRPVIHLNHVDCPRRFERAVTPGPTGAIHHVAFNCSGYDEMIKRLETAQLEHHFSAVPQTDLRQIFVKDPNDVLLELNFLKD